VAGSRGERVFEGPLLTVKYFFDCLDVDFYRSLLYRKIDQKGEIRNHPTALKEAFALGEEIAEGRGEGDDSGQGAVVWEKCEVPSAWIGLLADSHDHVTLLQKAVQICNQNQVGLVLHAGDYVAPFALSVLEELNGPYLGVFGNNDREKIGLENRSGGRVKPGPRHLEIGSRHLLLAHDLERVWGKGSSLASSNRSLDIMVHGHTHRPEVRREGSTLLVNPGEVGGWLTGKASMALLHMGTMETKIVDLAP